MRNVLRHLVLASIFFLLFTFQANAAEQKNWTFLFYMNGNNNLDEDTEETIKSMEKVGSNDQINIVIQWASLRTEKSLRMLIHKSNNPNEVSSPVLQDLGYVDAGDFRTLKNFIKWGVKNYPAKHYFINVSDHGSGWHDLKGLKDGRAVVGDISLDEISGNVITTEQLGKTMRYAADIMGHKVDVFASDACDMAMIEVATEMSGSVRYYAGAEASEPAYGWPYETLVKRWEAKSDLKADTLVKILVKSYIEYYNEIGMDSVNYSAFDMKKLKNFNQAVADVGADIRQVNATTRAKILAIARKTTEFGWGDYIDLMSFVKRVDAARLGIDSAHIKKLKDISKQFIIANGVSPDFEGKTFGVSIWLSYDRDNYTQHVGRYQKMSFDKSTQWSQAIDFLLQGVH